MSNKSDHMLKEGLSYSFQATLACHGTDFTTSLRIATQGSRLRGHFVRTKHLNMLYEGDLHIIVNPCLSGRALET
jgi:hypothetical protein